MRKRKAAKPIRGGAASAHPAIFKSQQSQSLVRFTRATEQNKAPPRTGLVSRETFLELFSIVRFRV
jgi:hypothetical protein